ncbi:MAG: phosphoglycerate dehydrogenase [Lachnospiraceae bacterium]
MKIKCLNPIAKVGLDRLEEGLILTENYDEADAVLVRSAVMHDMGLPENLLAIARAGAGVNNIPLQACAEKGIVVFNTPGANANGVKELVIAGMMMAARDIVGGINWVSTQRENADIAKAAEKQKKHYAGTEVLGKKMGVIGLGAIGYRVANAANSLGMDVYGFDPGMPIEYAWSISRNVHRVTSVDEIFSSCDYITIHVPANPNTKGMINKAAFDKMKDGVVILNFARDVLVNDDDMLEALQSGKVAKYVTDFPNEKSVKMPNTIVIPHLGASTEESEDNCAMMAVDELNDYLLNGNIKNSVNFPACSLGNANKPSRICIFHRNKPSMISRFTALFGEDGMNIAEMVSKSRGEYAYCMFDLDEKAPDMVYEQLNAMDDVLKVRIL